MGTGAGVGWMVRPVPLSAVTSLSAPEYAGQEVM